MKKTMKLAIHVFLVCTLLCMSMLHAFAETGEISPRLTNVSGATTHFEVVDGEAYFYASYEGRAATFSQAQLRVQVQKKVLGLFWRNVGDEWVGYNSVLDGYFYDSISVDGTGTYRANFTLTIYGTQGVNDVIEDTIEVKYS